jgi:hypothetical protein
MLACGVASAQQINAYSYKDQVFVTGSKPLAGPGGMQTSCIQIAEELGSDGATTEGGVLYDGLGHPWQQYAPSQGLFGIPFVNWTPETVSFLKSTIDQCAQDSTPGHRLLSILTGGNNRGMSMSPQLAKDVVDRIYATAQATNEQAQQLAQAEQQAAAQKAAQQQALAQHVADLKTGKAKIANMDDAIEFYSAKDVDSIIASPMLTPDGGYYAGRVTLDAQQQKDVLRGKITNYVDLSSSPPRILYVAYVFLKDKDAKVFDPSDMRLNRTVRVVGRYVQNVQYDTVSGEPKTSPVLDVMYLGQ